MGNIGISDQPCRALFACTLGQSEEQRDEKPSDQLQSMKRNRTLPGPLTDASSSTERTSAIGATAEGNPGGPNLVYSPG